MKRNRRLLMLAFGVALAALVFSSFSVGLAETKANVKAIYAFKYGETTFPNYAAFWTGDPRFNTDQPKRIVYMYFWLIQTADRNIMVDTGCGPDYATRYAGYQSPVDLLGKVGLKPEQIDTVIISHPHFDHVDGIPFFTKAKYYIQRTAYRFIVEDATESSYIRNDGLFPRKKDAQALLDLAWDGRLKLLDGDTDVLPGIKTIQVGGHFPGLEITVVDVGGTKPVILASDAVHQYDNLEKNKAMGLFQGNLKDTALALEKIASLNGIVVAGHDVQVIQRFKVVQEGVIQVF